MRCVRCQEENPVGAKFCNACGARLEALCPACRHLNRAGSRFCNECGAEIAAATSAAPRFSSPASYTPRHLAEKILTSKAALEGERRNVTVLFADIADFTALAEQRDPEEVHQIIDRCFELVTAEIHRFEGTINQYTGDGVMALFGAPIAHEDAPRRAIHAALAIQRAMHDWGTELQRRIGRPLEMRIGINTGPVVIGKIGDDLRMDYTAVGDTTNLAARLQQTARPGTVVISAATHRLVAGYFETVWPWPEPRGHSLWKLGVAHLYRDDHGRAEAAFREATSLLDVDVWGRWLWEISLLRSLGELALSQGRNEEAWDYASRSLELATRCRHRKHTARARTLQGRILAGRDHLEDAVTAFRESIAAAEGLGSLREGWMGQAALAQALGRLGRDREAEVAVARAGTALDAIVSKLTMPGLRDRFLGAEPVREVYRLVGRRPASASAPQPGRGEGSSTR